MKKISIILSGLLMAVSVLAQQNISKVNITVNGNKNLELSVDGKYYNLSNSSVLANKTIIALNNLDMAQHILQFTRTYLNTKRTDIITAVFNLRSGYDMQVNVNANGSLELIEKKITAIAGNQPAMGNTRFNALLKNVRTQQSANNKRAVIANAFNNTDNYFTAFQSVQLIQLVNAQNYRLQLAKLSYRGITDPDNFDQLYDLLNNQASKDELELYVNNYNDDNINLKVAMQGAAFNTLYNEIKGQWPVATQFNSLSNAFNNTANYFTTYQASQLIQIVVAENYRLQLIKLSYRSTTDPVNFGQLFDLLNSQASKDELTAFVSNGYTGGGTAGTAMTEANFNSLYEDIKKQWPVSTQLNTLTSTFKNVYNYFTTTQASMLIQIVGSESSRLQLAKLSYHRITDPVNFSQVYNLFGTQASRDELAVYINNNNGGIITNVAMSDANFNTLYSTIQKQYFPNEKMNSLSVAFNSTLNFFTTAQAKQLIPLVSFESNKLILAKLSYRTITDKLNFSQLYDLLGTQASRNELDAYVKAYKD